MKIYNAICGDKRLGFPVLLLCSLIAIDGRAQTVSPNKTAAQLASALVGPGVTVSNAGLNCHQNANGTFTGGTGNLGISNGILLTTGSASAVANPASFFEDTQLGRPGDPNLTLLSGAMTYDACVLEFDFVPNGDSVNFRYQFASEEYPDFTCTQFNDVFGFFISGPGYSPNTNIALVPNTNIPVAINSVNGGTPTGNGTIAQCNAMGAGSPFPAYFLNNTGNSRPVYDGMTVVLNAKAAVTPCSTYHFKLGVADATDQRYSSGVFLQQGSLTVLPPAIVGCPADITQNTGASATGCGATVSWTPPTAANNCLNVTTSSTYDPGDFFPVGTTTVTYTFSNAGGNSTCSFHVTVLDNTVPVITCPANATISCEDNSAPSSTGTAIATDNCVVSSLSPSDVSTQDPNTNSSGHYNYTITRTWTATDNHGNSSSCAQVITVQDITDPTAVCKAASVTLSGGTASITPADVDGGSTDNCGPVSLVSVSPGTFSCADAGANVPVTLTVQDVSGNTATCTAMVTVNGVVPSCTISVTPANNTYTGGMPTNIYLGYGPSSATATVNPVGGGPFTYVWSGPTGYLSCTTCAAPVFTPTTGGTYMYTVTVTNSFGCTTTCSVTFCVKDIRVSGNGNNQKVYVCHVPNGNPGNAHTLAISVNAVPSHLSHPGDQLGQCGQTCGAPVNARLASRAGGGDIPDEELHVQVYPNPFRDGLHIRIESTAFDAADVVVTDVAGKKIEVLHAQPVGQEIVVGRSLAAGTYMVEVRYGSMSRQVKVIKLQ